MKAQRRYPAGSENGRQLFLQLLGMMAEGRYDDDFLAGIVAYRERYPQSEKFDIFYARYALYHGNTAVALEYARAAEKKRPLNLMVWQLLAEVLLARSEAAEALLYEGLCAEFYELPLTARLSQRELTASLAMLSKTVGVGNYAPFMTKWMVMTEAGLEARRHTVVGDFWQAF